MNPMTALLDLARIAAGRNLKSGSTGMKNKMPKQPAPEFSYDPVLPAPFHELFAETAFDTFPEAS